MAVELSRVVAERDALAAQIRADAVTMSDKIQHATKQGTTFVIFSSAQVWHSTSCVLLTSLAVIDRDSRKSWQKMVKNTAHFCENRKNRDSRKSWQKMVKNTAHFCENRKNHGKITAVYIAANLLKLMVSNSRKIYILGKNILRWCHSHIFRQ